MNLIPILFLALGQQVTLPQEIYGQPGGFISIPASSDSKSVQWVVLDQGLNLFPTELLKDTSTAVVTTTIAGKYRVLAYCAKSDQASKPAICLVVIAGEKPPAPAPINPDEIGKLERDLKTLYSALNESEKQDKCKRLSAIYKSLGQAVLAQEIGTAGELLQICKAASGKVLNPSDLREIRVRLQSELQGAGFPDNPATVLDEKIKKIFSDKFLEISSTLERIIK